MADMSPGGAPIEALLQERARFQQWLAKLDSAAGSAPPAVRQKVRADYRGRLEAVIEQLKSHAATIQAELDRHRTSQRELDTRRASADETLAEAQVRYAVGEYSDDEWNRLSAEGNGALEALQRELANVGAEIARLVEVQGLIAQPAPAAQPPEPDSEPEPEPEPEAPPEPEPVATAPHPRPPSPIEMLPDPMDFASAAGTPASLEPLADYGPAGGAPRFVPKPAPEPSQARPSSRPTATSVKPGAPPLDELAFLKSVGGDKPLNSEERKPRRSGETARPGEPVATSAPAQPSAKPGQASQAKTLKCGECGTLNRPTEWYCERCGAELAAL
jgi:hypothetical protein